MRVILDRNPCEMTPSCARSSESAASLLSIVATEMLGCDWR